MVLEGELEVISDGNPEPAKLLTPGQSFGELALLHDAPRRASVRCKKASTLGVLRREDFQKAVRNQKLMEDSRVYTLITEVPPFSVCQKRTLVQIAQTATQLYVEQGNEVANM